jgi:hypothetical protein
MIKSPMHRRGPRAIVALLLASVLFGARADLWRRVAESHVQFARALAADGIRLNPEFFVWVDRLVGYDCTMSASKAGDLDAAQSGRIALYVDQFCKPWTKAWDKAIGACDRERPPDWCGDDQVVMERMGLESYLATLTSSLGGTDDATLRYNIMRMIVGTATPHTITEFPRGRVDEWMARAAAEFLRTAAPDDAIDIARSLQDTWVGLGPAVAREFSAYARKSPALTDGQRATLNDLIALRYKDP